MKHGERNTWSITEYRESSEGYELEVTGKPAPAVEGIIGENQQKVDEKSGSPTYRRASERKGKDGEGPYGLSWPVAGCHVEMEV